MLKKISIKENVVACWVNPEQSGKHEQSLVFIHGSGGNSSTWTFQYANLYNDYNVVAIDLPGHGRSGGQGEKDIADYVWRLREILDVLKVDHPILIGHSLGAAISLCFAAKYPREASGVVAVGGGITMPVTPDILDGFRKEPQLILDLMCKFSLARANRPALYESLRTSLGQASLDVVANDMLACSRFDLTGEVSKILVPVLAVCGTEDKMMPPASSKQIADRIPGAKLVLIEGAGHMVMLEKPADFNEVMKDFASTVRQTAAK
jgi:pimeloyl-ACP methyl ester carboxylesterase